MTTVSSAWPVPHFRKVWGAGLCSGLGAEVGELALPSLAVLVPSFLILVCSLSFHEAAHAWMADRLGDPTARNLGRLTLNPLAHIDWIGTVLFPLVAMISGAPLIGWAKPVPVDFRNLRSPQRDFAIVAAAGPISNMVLAIGGAVIHRMILAAHGADALQYRTGSARFRAAPASRVSASRNPRGSAA